MIQANSLVFPKPNFTDIRSIQKHLVFIPKNNTNLRHYYSSIRHKDQLAQLIIGLSTQRTQHNIINNHDDNDLYNNREEGDKDMQIMNNKIMINQQNQSQNCTSYCYSPRFRKLNAISSIKLKENKQIYGNHNYMNKDNFQNKQLYIPCVFIKGSYHDNKLIIYFHSNGQDMITAFKFVQNINRSSGRAVLMMEYPGYSVYNTSIYKSTQIRNKNMPHKQNTTIYESASSQIQENGCCLTQTYNYRQTTAQQIEKDAINILKYMKQTIGYELKNITILGRSIGSGPAVYVSSVYPVGALILLSPFISLKHAVKDLYGSLCSTLIKQRFNNKQRAKLVQSPCLIIHGLQDTIISYQQSVQLNKQFKSYTVLKLVQKMKHNCFNFNRDFILHLNQFLDSIQSSSMDQFDRQIQSQIGFF